MNGTNMSGRFIVVPTPGKGGRVGGSHALIPSVIRLTKPPSEKPFAAMAPSCFSTVVWASAVVVTDVDRVSED